jgi:glycosyltransferase involved in cell wall biosynthesis
VPEPVDAAEPGRPLRILVLSWRDGRHPEAGGAEVFLERVTARFAERGHEVTVMSARYPGSLAAESTDRRRLLRRGGRFTVYPQGMRVAAAGRRRYDVVMDVQNGVPFWTPLVTRVPVVNVVHHVHREQWPEVFGPARAKLGWWLESSAAPLAYRSSRYIAVSTATRDELKGLGVKADRVEVVLSGLDTPTSSVVYDPDRPPSLVVLGRLVPHKRVELALDTLAQLQATWPDLTLTVVGQGYWLPELQEHAAQLGVEKAVRFAGFVSNVEKADLLSAARVNLLPSLKEGWGLAIVEAAALGTPSVALRSAGGTAESIVEGETGLLADGEEDFVAQVSRILEDADLRARLSVGARAHAAQFSWDRTGDEVLAVLSAAAASRRRGQPPS